MGTNKQNNMTAEEIKKVLDERRGAELYLSKIEEERANEAQIKFDNERKKRRFLEMVI